MNNRLTSDSANTVSLFPFLAVLLCTMGALLVLLVVLAQRAGERVVAETVAEAPQPAAPATIRQVPSKEAEEAELLALELKKVRAYQKKLTEMRKQAEQRLQDEQQKLSHLEQHTRALEHELARLSLASEQLKATAANQSVDQQQAEQELARLQELIKDSEARLVDLREENHGKKSYAIVPYRGPNGTYRKPIYIECCKDGIILHPEGARLDASDFRLPGWAGNPLAAALRATREHVNAQAVKAGAPEPPDPYPVILVRPDGISQYSVARAAITSWDASFGYEFIDADWSLEFPEGPDPLLAREQEHAIMLARERLARRVRSAPSQFRGTGLGGGGSVARSGGTGSYGSGTGQSTGESNSGSQLGQSQQDGSTDGNGFAANQSTTAMSSGAGETAQQGEHQFGAMAGDDSVGNGSDSMGESPEGTSETGEADGENSSVGERYAQTSGSTGVGGSSSTHFGSPGGGQSGGNGGSTGGSAVAGGASSSGGGSSSSGQSASIADSQGRNWAVKKNGGGSLPIRRPIQVVVRENQLAILPSRHAIDGEAATGKVISLNQPMSQISNEFVAALRTRVDEWGMAGSGLYWRPVLKLNVGPGAEQTASEVLQLLKDSGVEVSLPETARASQGGADNATR